MPTQQIGSLEVAQDLTFHRRFWTFQRIGWAAMALVIVAALAGLFGSGPLSDATAQSGDEALMVDYPRFGRFLSLSTIEIALAPQVIRENEVQIWIDSSYLNRVYIENILPEPDSVEVGEERYVFTFAVSGEADYAEVSIHVRNEEPGLQSAEIGIVDGPSIRLRQFVYP